LFVAETGRTDLADPARAGENAALLYDAIHEKIGGLGDQALIFPAHGAGSPCGGNISERDDSTIGIERRTNPVFILGREAFIAHKRAEKLPRPPYFAHMEQLNLRGGRPLQPASRVRLLQPAAFRKAMQAGLVIDTRGPDAWAAAHIPGSYNIWLNGLSNFAGWIADERTALFLVTERPADIEAAVLGLARIGIDSVEAALAGGMGAWREGGFAFGTMRTVSAAEAAPGIRDATVRVLDVRDEGEWREKHIPAALHIYVGQLERDLPPVPKDSPLVVHCSVGNRSGLAASILARNGFTNVCNMLGGIRAWQELGLPLDAAR
jgi:hydroxyacylglutathione hydrolase